MGEIITFYSYKGGVGRTMALANIAVLLSQWGYNVLMVDWDLEAPGLEFFFEKFKHFKALTNNKPPKTLFEAKGVIELLHHMKNMKDSQSSSGWQDLCVEIQLPNSSMPLHFLSAGNTDDQNYFSKVMYLKVDDFYENRDGGNLIENLRNEWKQAYDFVLIDSRTGVTDFGGICTVQLPDILALFSSTTKQGLKGIIEVAKNVTDAQQKLPLEHYNLVSVPIPSRIEVSMEFELLQEWLNKLEKTVSDLYDNWLPVGVSKRQFIELTKIPYIPYYSFGEKLAVLEDNTTDPHSIAYTYETLSALFAHKLESIEQLMENRSEFVKSVIKTPDYKNKPKTFDEVSDSLQTAYNNFYAQPLRGEKREQFYIDDFTKDSVKGIITTIRISKRFKKMLVIGHRGCGKSTILNKVAEELQNDYDYHVVAFSIAEVTGMMEIETVDILFATYLQVLQSVEKLEEFDHLRQSFRHFMKSFSKNDFKLEEISLLDIALQFKVKPDFRATIKEELRHQIDALQKNISEACHHIHQQKGKEVLIIIDDLNQLETQLAEPIFYDHSNFLLLPEVKIIYTFPLESYYCSEFIRIKDRYQDQFIPVINLQTAEGSDLESSRKALTKLIRQRIDQDLVTEEAINYVIDMSGGLLRDLVKFMQDACHLALAGRVAVIDKSLVQKVVNKHIINDYNLRFDFPKYTEKVQSIAKTKKAVDNDTLVYLLRYLFVLEYRYNETLWYDVHPCLKKVLESETQ